MSAGTRGAALASGAALVVALATALAAPVGAASGTAAARSPQPVRSSPAPQSPQTPPSAGAGERVRSITIFDRVELSFEGPDAPKTKDATAPRGELLIRDRGQTADRTLRLPPEPDAREAMSVTGLVIVEPIVDPKLAPRPGDPWTRVGSVAVVMPMGGGRPPLQVELMRFVTGFGAASRYEADLTPFLPVLWGERTFRAHLDTWKAPGWRVTFELRYEPGAAGIRRPTMVVPLFDEPRVTRGASVVQGSFTLLPGLDRPRLRILTTGHGSELGDEFRPRTHVVRVDGVEVARWRPWREDGAGSRSSSPWAERRTVDGREVWASDADRSGWVPGRIVEPFILPLDELRPGSHRVEVEVIDIRATPEDQPPDHWRLSACVVADEAWPKPVR